MIFFFGELKIFLVSIDHNALHLSIRLQYIAQKPSKMEEVGELFNDVSEGIFLNIKCIVKPTYAFILKQ